ncbi:PPD7, partial [Symbiodinium sp. CCMP2456]
MDPGMPPDLLALSTCLDATHGASDVAQQLRVLSAQRGSAGRFHSEVAECLMRMKEIDGIAKVEQCRLSESGLTERSRIVEEARSQRYKHLVDVMQVSVKEDAQTARQEISARAEVSKETVKGNVQIQATYWGLVLGSLSLAVVSDFLGIMRLLLSLNPSGARQMGLDEVYPVEGLKTYRQRGRYRLRYPGEWLFDQSVAFSKQAAIELPTLRQKKRIVPDAAFGPAGGGLATTATAQNLSVVVQPVKAQRLEDLMGEPEEAFRKFAAETLAAE